MKKELFLKIADQTFSESKSKHKDFLGILDEMETVLSFMWEKDFSKFSKKIKKKVKSWDGCEFHSDIENIFPSIQIICEKDTKNKLNILIDEVNAHNKKEPICELKYDIINENENSIFIEPEN